MRLKQSYYGWGLALLALTAARVLMGALVPLTPDEAYYRLWALAPAAGYLDHPPMVAVFIRLGLLLGEIRLAASGSWGLFLRRLVRCCWHWRHGTGCRF
ncbi:hypothetical protein [Acetobacter tropicalis]|uniref:hypothetical protein n=1 Tax=Acetobacter tropicalis TaxID=104102 RepID=UPI001FC96145|nr:hypothetical protein [Acetobacter tropicalis]